MTNQKEKNNRTGELFSVKYSKMLSFSQVAEALMGLIYHRPSGENFSSRTDQAGTTDERILMLTLKQADVRLEYKARVRFALPYSWLNINWIVA